MKSSDGTYTRRGLLRTGIGAAGVGALATGTSVSATAQSDVYGGWLSDEGTWGGTTTDATGNDEVIVEVGAEGNQGFYAFNPAALLVDPGTTITWEWTGEGGGHNVIHEPEEDPARDETTLDSREATDSEIPSAEGTTYEETFDEESSFYPYYCDPHLSLGMKGVVVVGEDNAETDLTEYNLDAGGDGFDTSPVWGGAAAFGLVSFLGLAAYNELQEGQD